jgi:hypothetical protein
VTNGCFYISSCDAGDRRLKLIRGLQFEELFLLPQVWDRKGKVEIRRLDVVRMHEIYSSAPCPSSVRCPERKKRFNDLFQCLCRVP